MNDLPKELFANITEKGLNWGFVCVEHKCFIPCRKCLYKTPATTPYSETPEDIKMVSDYQKGKNIGWKLAECGTRSAYNRHLRYKETPCQLCKDANTAHLKEWRTKNPSAWKKIYDRNNKRQREKKKQQ